MSKIRVAVIGFGNIGRYCVEATLLAPDMELAGIVRRDPEKASNLAYETAVVSEISALGKVDAAILAVPSRLVREYASKYLRMGINTVDSFDIHNDISALRADLNETAVKNNAVAMVSAGWDPGSDSVVRALLRVCAPTGVTYTNFGPGMSMGHTVAAKAIPGVSEAISLTIPLGTGIHRRMVYVRPEPGADMDEIRRLIKNDAYFASDETHVIETADIGSLADQGHGVKMARKGTSSGAPNQLFEFDMRVNNPALTAQIMVGAVRASVRQKPGAYTMIETPVIDFLYGERDDLIKNLV